MNYTKNWIILLLCVALLAVSVRLAYDINSQQSKAPAEFQDEKEEMAINVIMTRTSVREYSPQEVPDSLVTKILKAGMAAPSAKNKQPWEFVVIKKKGLKERVATELPNAAPVKDCSFAVVVCGNLDEAMEVDNRQEGNWTLDCSAASENMLVAAHALGIGSVWCGIYPNDEREAKMSNILNLPDSIRPFNIIAFGYPSAPAMPKDKWDEQKVYLDSYNKAFYD